MPEIKFKNKKLNRKKLLPFGFIEKDGVFTYSSDLADAQMKMCISIYDNETLFTKVIDKSSGEEYTLHLLSDATGAFVGQVKTEYGAVLEKISSECFETDIFKSEQAKRLIDFIRDKYGDELEFLWRKFSDNAIWRRKDANKWYAVLLIVSKRKLGIDSDEVIEIIDLRIEPDNLVKLIDNKKYFAGYHMNKKHWCTIKLDGSVPFEEICERISVSYNLAKR